MEMSTDPSAAAAQMSVFDRILGTFTRPRAVFEANKERPVWLAPFAVLIIVTLAAAVLIMPLAMTEQKRQILESDRIPQENKAEMLQRMEGMSLVIKLGSAVLGFAVTALLGSAILLFGGNFLLGGELRFVHSLALFLTAALVEIPSAVIKIPLMLLKQSIHVYIGPAALLSAEAVESTWGQLLARLDAFGLWRWVLITFGLAIMARTTVRRAATFTVPLWIFWTVVVIMLSRFQRM